MLCTSDTNRKCQWIPFLELFCCRCIGAQSIIQRTRGGFTRAAIDVILKIQFGARGFGGRHASTMSSRQLKEVIQVAHTNVGSVASLGALVGGEVHR